MRTSLRQAREQAGVSMADLARRLGMSISSVSTLELNDERGAAKASTVERALVALDLARWEAVLPVAELEAIVARANETAQEVAWQMALESQTLSSEAVSRIVRRLVAKELALLQ